VHCPVHQPRVRRSTFSYALSGGSPDSYCALSGVHRIATMRYPVCTGQLLCAIWCAPDRHCRLSDAPITRFKKRPLARPQARDHISLAISALCSLSGDLPRRRLFSCNQVLPFILSGEQPQFLSPLSVFHPVSTPFHPPLIHHSNSLKIS
jgi:hypothetical protein